MREIQFNEWLDVKGWIGKILICGLEGYGKTLLLSYIAVEKMRVGEQDCWLSYEEVDKINALGYNLSKDYDHTVFVAFMTINCSGTNVPERTSYACDPFHIGLYMDDWYTDLYPPYSAIFIPEIQRVYNSYNAEKIRPEVYGYWETGRQAKISLVGDAQRYMMVAKPLRDIMNRFVILTSKVEHIKNDKGEVVAHRLFVLEFEANKDLEHWGTTTKKDNAKEFTLILPRVQFGNYDSYHFFLAHLKGRVGQDFTIKKYPEVTNILDVENLDDTKVPEGFLLGKKSTKVDNEPNISAPPLDDGYCDF